MGFDKSIPSTISEYKVYEANTTEELIKVASSDIDIPDGFEFDSDYFYLWIRIISSGEYYGPNKNGDYFPTEELESSYETFKEAHAFKNHENKKAEKAIGKIFSVRWNPIMKCVEIFKGIDRKLAPEIVRGFEKGFLTDVSMGCRVKYTVCSVCGNKARRQSEFCDHIKRYKMKYLGNGERVFEINFEPKFHDSSVVLNGAERVAKALVIFDKPREDALTSSFRKAASVNGSAGYVRLSDNEMEKVAEFEQNEIHPLLRPEVTEKTASDNPYLDKIAELEKEVSGKLLNIVSAPSEAKPEAAEQLIQIIKFLTEKRMGDDTLSSIANTLNEVSKAEEVSLSKAFSAFLSIAELMGIELFPTELHTILCELTNAKVESSLKLSDVDEEGELYPSEFAKGVKSTLQATEQLPSFSDTSDFFNTYNELPFFKDEFKTNPFDFLESMKTGNDLDDEVPTNIVKVIRRTLGPMMKSRSHHPSHLLPRLSIVLSGHRPIVGDSLVKRDVDIMSHPKTLGDLLAMISYKNYQDMRPKLIVTKMVKSAMFFDEGLDKIAKETKPFKGIKRRHLAMAAIPAFYGASLFQKSRQEDGKRLTDAESFIAKNPGVLAGGVILAGKPLSIQVAKGAVGARNATSKGADKVKGAAVDVGKRVKDGFDKLTSEEYTSLVKMADTMDSGQFNAFDDEMISKFSSDYELSLENAALLKVATLLDVGGMSRESSSLLESAGMPEQAIGVFLKSAGTYASAELEKAADDFTNTLVLDGLVDKRNFTRTLHGRMLDAMVFKQLGNIGKPKEQKVDKGGGFDVQK